MKIEIINAAFTYGDTDINEVQDELKAMAQEASEATDIDFDVCYKNEVEMFKKALKDYTTTIEITMADIEYALENDYCVDATDVKVGDVEAYFEFSGGRRKRCTDFTVLDIKKQLMENPDEGNGHIVLAERAKNVIIEVKACFKNEYGDDDYYWVDFEPRWW